MTGSFKPLIKLYLRHMKLLLKKALGIVLIITGLGLVSLGCSILLQELSWLMFGGFMALFGCGIAVSNFGLALMRDKDIWQALRFIMRLRW